MKILRKIKCPHCWHRFSPDEILWIAEHTDLLGDPRLGSEEQQRFLPTRFNVDGAALDARSFACHGLACPNCHLELPRCMLEMDTFFMSIFGAPGSGKSYFLAAMTWQLRKELAFNFSLQFTDADPALNRNLHQYEEALFTNPAANDVIPLADLIRKTELQGELYDSVNFGSQATTFSRPFMFSMQPQDGHANYGKSESLLRTICLYDNAGEHFEPGRGDTASSPVTRHMAQSQVLFFVFDPLQDGRFRDACRQRNGISVDADGSRLTRQEPYFQEAATRIRRHARLSATEKYDRPLVVILTKFDVWSPLIDADLSKSPYKPRQQKNAGSSSNSPTYAVDFDVVERHSELSRELLLKTCPEIVAAAEGFAKHVVYIPASALGLAARDTSGVFDANGDPQPAIRPADVKPFWVTVPFVYALARWSPGLIPYRRKKSGD